MTRLPAPEQWVLHAMNEMEVAEMIEQHIDYVDEDGRSVHLPMPFVRHYVNRDDGVLPTVVAITTLPIVLGDGSLLAPDGLDRDRGIIFEIQKELRAVLPRREDCTAAAIRKAMEFLCDEWLCDVATDYTGKCILIATALTMIERSLLPDRPAFFVTAGRRGNGKTTTLIMLIMAVTGIWPAAAAWSTNEEERRKALMSYFLYGVQLHPVGQHPARLADLLSPHREILHLRLLLRPQARRLRDGRDRGLDHPPVHRQQHRTARRSRLPQPQDPPRRRSPGPRKSPVRASRSGRLDREPPRRNPARALHHPARQPDARSPLSAKAKTRFKMWWRLVGSAVEHGANLIGQQLDFQELFTSQEEDDEDTASLADALAVMQRRWPMPSRPTMSPTSSTEKTPTPASTWTPCVK